ncbi:hypothetical protein REPUB_Repub01dG0141300 [Reevesia pubescens]
MCKGLQQENTSSSCLKEGVSPNATSWVSSGLVNCELCNSRASLYCQADDAYLCRKCDKWVHEANFLALRHIRCFLCSTCQNLTQRYLIGASNEVLLPSMILLGTANPIHADASVIAILQNHSIYKCGPNHDPEQMQQSQNKHSLSMGFPVTINDKNCFTSEKGACSEGRIS